MYVNWSGRCVDVYNDYNAKMFCIYTDKDVENAVVQQDRQITVLTKDRINVYRRNGDTFTFSLWSSMQRGQ